MSRKNNVNPDYYKLAGRERQGEAIIPGLQKQTLAEEQAETERWREKHNGPPPWEATPPSASAETEPRPKPRRRSRASKTSRRPAARRQAGSTSRMPRARKSGSRARARRPANARPRPRKRA